MVALSFGVIQGHFARWSGFVFKRARFQGGCGFYKKLMKGIGH
jgi:hypothetical protein